MKRSVAVLLGSAALLAAVLAIATGGERRAPVSSLPPVASPGALAEPVEVALGAAAPAAERPPSLVGTDEAGAFVVAADGRFVATPDALDRFDYWLAATGEETPEQIRARIVASIRAELEGDAAAAAEALLDDYLRYRERGAELLTGEVVGEDLERRIQYIRELRREIFGAEVARALFGEQEARWSFDLERRRIWADASLAPAERERRLAELAAEAPDGVRETRARATAHRSLRDAEARLRQDGAGASEIAALREQRFGAEAAARLAALDAERARWQVRLDAYRAERERTLAGLAPAERDAAHERLLARHFEAGERARVRALEEATPAARD